MTRKTYCGNLLWQSSLTLLVLRDRFGASGPYARLAEEFGFTPENCLRLARELK